jgi:hypothetical protein
MVAPAVAVRLLTFGIPLLAGSAMLAVYTTGTGMPSAVFLNLAKHNLVIVGALTLSILVYR